MSYTFAANASMDQLLAEKGEVKTYEAGEVVKGIVVGMSPKQVLIDLEGDLTGVIRGRELNDVMGTVKTLSLGQEVTSIVINPEDDNGMLLLSFR
ncbi:MAG TPA: S1 RNA-binding domain-containing protein, partial [Candidatus Gracilibacteria bacterium]|nr:S1 RNA-binding domain-containing protein [Candidatus Gracilibacteria bacterium]